MRKNCAELTHFSDVAMMLVFTSFALKVHMSVVMQKVPKGRHQKFREIRNF